MSEIELNTSPTTMELKEPHPSRLVGGAQTHSSLIPQPRVVVDKNSRGISQTEDSQSRNQAPQPRDPVPEK